MGTTAPILAGASADAEFMDAKGVRAHFGLSRSHLYRLLDEKAIKSVSFREEGHLYGKRLFVTKSIRDYLNGRIA